MVPIPEQLRYYPWAPLKVIVKLIIKKWLGYTLPKLYPLPFKHLQAPLLNGNLFTSQYELTLILIHGPPKTQMTTCSQLKVDASLQMVQLLCRSTWSSIEATLLLVCQLEIRVCPIWLITVEDTKWNMLMLIVLHLWTPLTSLLIIIWLIFVCLRYKRLSYCTK